MRQNRKEFQGQEAIMAITVAVMDLTAQLQVIVRVPLPGIMGAATTAI